MPTVVIDVTVHAPINRVWSTVVDVERYPEAMRHVRSVTIAAQLDDYTRHTAWSVLLKGAVLEWVEEEHLDPETHIIAFRQVSGDLDYFDGRWALSALGAETTTVSFEVAFEIGIPSLADMLNPVAQRALRDNCAEMLRSIERQAIIG